MDVVGKIAPALVGNHLRIAPVRPLVPGIPAVIAGHYGLARAAGNHVDALPRAHKAGEISRRGLDLALARDPVGLAALGDREPVDPLLARRECRSRGIDLEIHPALHRQAAEAHQDAELYDSFAQGKNLHVRLVREAQRRTVVEFDFGPGRVGNELAGVPRQLLKKAEQVVAIPMLGRGMSSVNVAVAAAIVLYALQRDLGRKRLRTSALSHRDVNVLLLGPPTPTNSVLCCGACGPSDGSGYS